MSYLIVAVIAVIGWYLTTSHQAYKDGVRDNIIFWNVWWKCYTSYNIKQLIHMHTQCVEKVNSTTNKDEKQFYILCGIVIQNYITRKTRGKIKFVSKNLMLMVPLTP